MTTGQRCATCRYWFGGDSLRKGGVCCRIGHGHKDEELQHYYAVTADARIAVDGTACANLRTAPDFGCVQWAAREAATE